MQRGVVVARNPLQKIGERFGRLVIISHESLRVTGKPRRVLVECDCGTRKIVYLYNIVRGSTVSCGCVRRPHGLAGTAAYAIWNAMISRCYDQGDKAYAKYGRRGITVCERWRNVSSFYADMGDPPIGLTLDRIDNNKGYSLENCRWATPQQQTRNRSNTRYVEIDGVRKLLHEACLERSVSYNMVWLRLRNGWNVKEALTSPSNRSNHKMRDKSGKFKVRQ